MQAIMITVDDGPHFAIQNYVTLGNKLDSALNEKDISLQTAKSLKIKPKFIIQINSKKAKTRNILSQKPM